MFAVLAFLAFLAGEFKVKVGEVNWLYLGLAFIALHLLVPVTLGTLTRREP